jgi:hypothetical protein
MPPTRFALKLLKAIDEGMYLRIRAGRTPHRFIGIWAVVVDGRVFVRSWSLKPRSWWRTFLEEPTGAIEVAGREVPVRASQAASERLRDAIDQAYLAKYHTKGSIKYARDLGSAKSRDTTTELRPLPRPAVREPRSTDVPQPRAPHARTRSPRRKAS